jgi:steroid 5-alpha reductase family enzyme
MDPWMPVWQLALAALAGAVACSLLVWVVSVARRNVALADRAWSVLVMVSALVFVLGSPPLRDRVVVMLLLGAAWALRLSLFITWRCSACCLKQWPMRKWRPSRPHHRRPTR